MQILLMSFTPVARVLRRLRVRTPSTGNGKKDVALRSEGEKIPVMFRPVGRMIPANRDLLFEIPKSRHFN